MSIKNRIKDLADSHHQSIAEVERHLSFGNGTIAKWDTRSPSSEKLQKVADYFDVTVDYLLGRTNTPQYVSNDIKNTGLFRKAVKDNELSGSEQESLAEDMNEYLKFRAELLRKKRG